MLDDVKKMLKIRKKLKQFIYPFRVGKNIKNFKEVQFSSNFKIPTPYLYFNRKKIIIIAGNSNTQKKSTISFSIPFKKMNFNLSDKIVVQDLWLQHKYPLMSLKEFTKIKFSIPEDKVSNGGLLILEIIKGKKSN